MSRLNSDNPQTMPITDAVYGNKPRNKVEKDQSPRGHTWKLWQRLPQEVTDELYHRWPKEKK